MATLAFGFVRCGGCTGTVRPPRRPERFPPGQSSPFQLPRSSAWVHWNMSFAVLFEEDPSRWFYAGDAWHTRLCPCLWNVRPRIPPGLRLFYTKHSAVHNCREVLCPLPAVSSFLVGFTRVLTFFPLTLSRDYGALPTRTTHEPFWKNPPTALPSMWLVGNDETHHAKIGSWPLPLHLPTVARLGRTGCHGLDIP